MQRCLIWKYRITLSLIYLKDLEVSWLWSWTVCFFLISLMLWICDVEGITHVKSFTDCSLVRISDLHYGIHISRLLNLRAGCICNVGCKSRHEKSSLGIMWEGDYNPHLSRVVMDEVKSEGSRVMRTRGKIGAPAWSKYLHKCIQLGKLAVEITPHAITKLWHHWNEWDLVGQPALHDRNAAMDKFLGKDRQRKQGGSVAFSAKEQLRCVELFSRMGGGLVDNL